MVIRSVVFLFFCFALLAAAPEDDWSKVIALKSGAEVRVLRKGKPKPVEGWMDEAREDALILVIRNEQVAIPKEEVERVEARPSKSRVTKTESVDTRPSYEAPATPNRPVRPGGPSGSASSGVSIGKADFELIYRRKPSK